MKIGIVNDLPIAVEILRRALAFRPDHRVIWVAHDGDEAVALCTEQTPDLVLMDLIMPGMDGVEATRRIMAKTPCAILVVTDSVGVNAPRVFDAMALGAVDAVDTPVVGRTNMGAAAAPLLRKIDAIGKLIGDARAPRAELSHDAPWPDDGKGLVAIGASAGGPGALATLLHGLPADFPAAVVIVQHVDEQFALGMADWLSQQSALPVRLAKEGDPVKNGSVLLAGTSDHLVLKAGGRLGYTAEPREHIYRPSVDVFFQSVGALWSGRVVGVLLTGMGRDGAAGLKALRTKGHYTIAQDKDSSAVYGMPKAAAAIGAAVDILSLDRIAPRLIDAFANRDQGKDD